MKFEEAFSLMRSGEKIRREEWSDYYFIFIKDGYIFDSCFNRINEPFSDISETVESHDMLSEDWSIYKNTDQ